MLKLAGKTNHLVEDYLLQLATWTDVPQKGWFKSSLGWMVLLNYKMVTMSFKHAVTGCSEQR